MHHSEIDQHTLSCKLIRNGTKQYCIYVPQQNRCNAYRQSILLGTVPKKCIYSHNFVPHSLKNSRSI